MKSIEHDESNLVDEYRERLAHNGTWNNIESLKTMRRRISDDADLSEEQTDELLSLINRRIKQIVAAILDGED